MTEVLIFITEEDKFMVRRARVLKAALDIKCRIVNRLSNDLDDLRLCGRYRALRLPRWVVLRDGEVIIDEERIPTYNEALQVLDPKGKTASCRTD